VSEVVIIDTLPGGFNQRSELLPEPIEILKFEKVSSKLSLERKVRLSANYITAEEGLKMIQKSERLHAKSNRKCTSCGGYVPKENFSRCNTCVKLKNVVD
jgi:formamidopyrimidine-DNA glycosylase